MTDTHTYDGKITITLRGLDEMKASTLEKKKELAIELYNNIKISEESKAILLKIIESMGTDANYDPTNRLNADDLVALSWEFRENEDFAKELEVQLLDMRTGFCAQGRTHRFYQILQAFL